MRTNCPNCGAPTSIDSRLCPFCDTPYVDCSLSSFGAVKHHSEKMLDILNRSMILTPNECRKATDIDYNYRIELEKSLSNGFKFERRLIFNGCY